MIPCTRTFPCPQPAESFPRTPLRDAAGVLCVCLFLLWPTLAPAQEKALPPAEALALIERNADNEAFLIVDLRPRREFDEGHIKGARQIDYYATNFKRIVSSLDPNATVLLYCQRGRQAPLAMRALEKLRFAEVFMLDGGFHDWVAAGLPVVY
jgi:rhodanese-related sulfurtransferase